jgi:hypothetical protein
MYHCNIQAKMDFLKWYLSVDSSEIYGKLRVFRPKKIKKIHFCLYCAVFKTIIKNMIDFYQLILSTDFQKFDISQI